MVNYIEQVGEWTSFFMSVGFLFWVGNVALFGRDMSE